MVVGAVVPVVTEVTVWAVVVAGPLDAAAPGKEVDVATVGLDVVAGVAVEGDAGAETGVVGAATGVVGAAAGISAESGGAGVLATILAQDIAAGLAEIGLMGTIGLSLGRGGGGGEILVVAAAAVATAAVAGVAAAVEAAFAEGVERAVEFIAAIGVDFFAGPPFFTAGAMSSLSAFLAVGIVSVVA